MATRLNCLHCGQRTQLCKDGTYRAHMLPGVFPETACDQSRAPFSPHGTRFNAWRPEGDSAAWRASCQCGEWEHDAAPFRAIREAWALHAGLAVETAAS